MTNDIFFSMGPCCICQCPHNALNLILLDKKAPSPGVGAWGCQECGLPLAGAIAVLCQPCFIAYQNGDAQIKFVCDGAPAAGKRVPVENLTEPFQHNRARHFIADKFSVN